MKMLTSILNGEELKSIIMQMQSEIAILKSEAGETKTEKKLNVDQLIQLGKTYNDAGEQISSVSWFAGRLFYWADQFVNNGDTDALKQLMEESKENVVGREQGTKMIDHVTLRFKKEEAGQRPAYWYANYKGNIRSHKRGINDNTDVSIVVNTTLTKSRLCIR